MAETLHDMKHYTVRKGKEVGIFNSWEEIQPLVSGFPDAKYKSFPSLDLAEEAFSVGREPYYQVQKKSVWKARDEMEAVPFVKESIAVDAACSGNPGELEYRGVDLQTGKELFHQRFEWGTNNIGEFLAIVHGMSWLLSISPGGKHPENNDTITSEQSFDKASPGGNVIYSDSKIAMNRVKGGRCKSKFKTSHPEWKVWKVVEKAEAWLEKHGIPYTLLKWKTDDWGEIPADFGRK